MKRALCLIATLLLSGCSARTSLVRLQGDPVSIAWLGGVWEGEYQAATSGRRGTLNFYLPSGTDSLVGDVMMTDPAGNVIHGVGRPDLPQIRMRSTQLLRIDVVIAQADVIRGVLEPYVAPDCNCVVSTTFFGRVSGNDISGTFETRGDAGYRGEGSWRMTRTGSTAR